LTAPDGRVTFIRPNGGGPWEHDVKELQPFEIDIVRGGAADFSNVQGGVTSTEEIVKQPVGSWHDFLQGMAFKGRR
jgi:hypothetical protein